MTIPKQKARPNGRAFDLLRSTRGLRRLVGDGRVVAIGIVRLTLGIRVGFALGVGPVYYF